MYNDERPSGTKGVLDSKDIRIAAGSGKEWGRAVVSGRDYLVFGKTVGFLKQIAPGANVEYTAKSNENGPGMVLTTIRQSDGSAPTTQATAAIPSEQVHSSAKSNRGNDNVQLSIFYGYAKDLVTAGVIKPTITSGYVIADLIGGLADELMDRFTKKADKEASSESNPTKATQS